MERWRWCFVSKDVLINVGLSTRKKLWLNWPLSRTSTSQSETREKRFRMPAFPCTTYIQSFSELYHHLRRILISREQIQQMRRSIGVRNKTTIFARLRNTADATVQNAFRPLVNNPPVDQTKTSESDVPRTSELNAWLNAFNSWLINAVWQLSSRIMSQGNPSQYLDCLTVSTIFSWGA